MSSETKMAYESLPIFRRDGNFPRDAEILAIAKRLLLEAEFYRTQGSIVYTFHLKACRLDSKFNLSGDYLSVKAQATFIRMDFRDIAGLLVQIAALEIVDTEDRYDIDVEDIKAG